MKVSRLIERLTKMNPGADVKLHSIYGESALFVMARQNDNNTVWLETESDCDMGAELGERFKVASEDGLDELDFYSELLDMGITIEMVRKYMGNETADHMHEFCYGHGLI